MVGPNELVRTINFPQNVRTMRIRTDGARRCTLTIEDVLKPGFSEYVFRDMRGELRPFAKPQVVATSCIVS